MTEFENDEIRFTMRMDSKLYELLKDSAKKNKRSIAKELEYITELHYGLFDINKAYSSPIERLCYLLEEQKRISELEQKQNS